MCLGLPAGVLPAPSFRPCEALPGLSHKKGARYHDGSRSAGAVGPPYDAVIMFRIPVLQALYTLIGSSKPTISCATGLSSMRFAGLALLDPVPMPRQFGCFANSSPVPACSSLNLHRPSPSGDLPPVFWTADNWKILALT
jgi:hypothetical protein